MITVEDMNSILQTYALHNKYHLIDTSLISTSAFTDIAIDFVNITHTISGSTHTFVFNPRNTAWTGGYYLLDSDGEYIDSNASYSYVPNTITYSTTDDSVQLVLHCSNLAPSFHFERLTDVLITENVSYGTHPSKYTFKNIATEETTDVTVSSSDWLVSLGHNHYAVRFSEKANATFNLNQSLVAGKQNYLNVSTDDVDCIITYLDKTVNYNPSDDGQLLIDLTGVYDITSVNVSVKVLGNETYLEDDLSFKLSVVPVSVNSFNDLLSEVGTGASEIHLTDDITMTSNLTVASNLILYGDDNTVDCDNYSIIVNPNVTFKCKDLTLDDADPCIVQGKNSTVDLTGCTFTNCTNSNSNNLGSVICCDIDIASLEVLDDFTTNISDCYFHNNHNCILSGGALNVDNSRYHNTDMSLTDVNNPAFLFQVDGEATITNSVFDIDYHESSNYDESNIMYAQALFICGETAIINNATYTDLNRDDNLNWFNSPYNNVSHIYLKYYYTQLEQIVYSSPTLGQEDKSICYAVSGVDWVYKKNVQITKASDDNQNTTRKIVWDD